jgi:hypothetical protein
MQTWNNSVSSLSAHIVGVYHLSVLIPPIASYTLIMLPLALVVSIYLFLKVSDIEKNQQYWN